MTKSDRPFVDEKILHKCLLAEVIALFHISIVLSVPCFLPAKSSPTVLMFLSALAADFYQLAVIEMWSSPGVIFQGF